MAIEDRRFNSFQKLIEMVYLLGWRESEVIVSSSQAL